ncbi:MAG: hypothetical protein K9N23_21020 [Akkermansiaceae bacterium]|nr:hypothetical protein [Akkermansiaceae bacterium]
MNQPAHILRTLDRHLRQSTRLILYGRAALALGYAHPLPAFASTMDVDAILPDVEMTSIDADEQFWLALERTNEELWTSGLYLTHLFADSQVILRPDWLEAIQPIPLQGLEYLSLFRPSTADLLLTKMMRVDPQDQADIRFLLAQPDLNPTELPAICDSARVPAIAEIQEAFSTNRAWLRRILQA